MWSVRILLLVSLACCATHAVITVDTNVISKEPQRHLLEPPDRFNSIVVPSIDEIKRTIGQLREFMATIVKDDQAAAENGIDQPDGNNTAVFGPHLITDGISLEIGNIGFMSAEITKRTLEAGLNIAFPDSEIPKFGSIKLSDTQLAQIDDFVKRLPSLADITLPCKFKEPIVCDSSRKYRTIDGSCNNLGNPMWGKSFTPFDRFLNPEYSGVEEPRSHGKSNVVLPGPRTVSNAVHTKSTAVDLDPPLSSFTMQFGQFVDHDITKTALAKARYNGMNLQCCNTNRGFNPDCFPFDIPNNDPYFDRDCMNFVRSLASPSSECLFGYREQLNELTHWIDGSAVYGSTQGQLDELLDPALNGKLKVSSGDLLPLDDTNESGCTLNGSEKCFRAGDVRVNVIPGLSSLHTIWMREHNRIADYFMSSPECYNWTSEQIFEEARRYVAAEIQHVTYNEFIPKLLSTEVRQSFDIIPLSSGYYTGYDPAVRPMIRNSFATAAYRMGHSLLRDHIFFNSTFFDLHPHFNNPSLVHADNGIEHCTAGLYTKSAQAIDEKMTTEVTWKLFETMARNGGDLAAFNIQRGRDHGLPPYTTFLHYCTGMKPMSDNFAAGVANGLFFHTQAKADQLKSIYSSTCDIDLFPGAMTETPLPGGRLGPTFTCILALQFKALKQGDRFFYEGNPSLNPHPFTPEELNGLRPITMAKIICENTKIDRIPKDVFLEPSDSNPYMACSELPDICFPKNGGWGEWQKSCCNSCCKIEEFRKCDNPPPNECGAPCKGYDYRYKFSPIGGGGCNCQSNCCNGCQ